MRHVTPWVFLAVCLCAVVALPAMGGDNPTKWREAIESASESLVKATVEDDTETILSYYTEDAVSLPNYSEWLDGKQAIAGYQEGMKAAGVKFQSMTFDPVDVWTCRDLVYEIGKYEVTLTAAEMPDPVTDKGKYMTVWEKQRGGDLKIKTEIWNSDFNPWKALASQPQADEAMRREYEGLVKARDTVKSIAENLKKRGMVGLDGDWLEAEGAYQVKSFMEGSNAEAAGVQIGDKLVKVNGIPLSDGNASRADAPNRAPGKEATITVLRDGTEHTMTLTLVAAPERVIAEEIGRYILNNYVNQ